VSLCWQGRTRSPSAF